jgi:UDP-glucose 4-epimerase
MKALVTGGSGFIGAHLVDELAAAGWKVKVLDLFDRRFGSFPDGVELIRGDVSNDYALREALVDVDVVFHLAWGSIHEVATRDPLHDIEMNVMPSVRLIDHCRTTGVGRVVFLSSGGTVYGPAKYLPLDEAHPTDPISAYGVTKLVVEKYLQMYHHLYGLDYVVLRPSVPYGPGQDPRRRQGAVNVFLYRHTRGEPIQIWGDGSVVRDYFFIDDLVSAALLAATVQELDGGRIFNIGGGRGYSLNELVQVVEQVTGRLARVEHQPGRRFDVPSVILDTSHAAARLKWAPKVELLDGVARTWEWIVGLKALDNPEA